MQLDQSVALSPGQNQSIEQGRLYIYSLRLIKLARIIHELASISRRDLFSQGISFLSRILIDICEKKKFPVESKIK